MSVRVVLKLTDSKVEYLINFFFSQNFFCSILTQTDFKVHSDSRLLLDSTKRKSLTLLQTYDQGPSFCTINWSLGRPQAWMHHKHCCKWYSYFPGFINGIHLTPGYLSGYRESALHCPQEQCLPIFNGWTCLTSACLRTSPGRQLYWLFFLLRSYFRIEPIEFE